MATGDNEANKLGINKIGRKGVNLPKTSETFTFKPVNGLSSVAVRVCLSVLSFYLPSAAIDLYSVSNC